MGNEIRDSALMGLTLIMYTALLVLIFFFSIQGKSLQMVGEDKKKVQQELLEYRELARYDNALLTGDEVIITVRKYYKLYDMYIEVLYNSGTFESLLTTDSDYVWSESRLRNLFYSDLDKYFKSELIRDNYTGKVKGFRFIKQQ